MLSLGLADLKVHVGLSLDDGAWLDSAFNASLLRPMITAKAIDPLRSFSESCREELEALK